MSSRVYALANQKENFSGVAGFSSAGFRVGSNGSKTQVPGAWVTGDFYATMGVNPVLGRLLARDDVQAVVAHVDPDNTPSVRLLRRLGFRHAATSATEDIYRR